MWILQTPSLLTDLLVLDAALTCDDPNLYVRHFNPQEFAVGKPWTLSGDVGKLAFQRGQLMLKSDDQRVIQAWYLPRFNTIKTRIKVACNEVIRDA